jgi:pimeloyl-ACP methyl ester carboxylesterase
MATFVLVHGAWHGSWCWKRVRTALQAQGHEVFTPTLTGVGERSHLLSPAVDLETHVADVENLMRWEDLSDVVLCGHSYGGCVISGVADRIPERIRALVYLDAFILDSGENLVQHLPEAQYEAMLQAAQVFGDGWKVSPIPAEVFNVNAADCDWVNRQCTVHSLACFEQRLVLSGGARKIPQVVFILASGFREGSPFGQFYEKAQARGWKTLTVPCGHDVMVDRPDELTSILVDVANERPSAV